MSCLKSRSNFWTLSTARVPIKPFAIHGRLKNNLLVHSIYAYQILIELQFAIYSWSRLFDRNSPESIILKRSLHIFDLNGKMSFWLCGSRDPEIFSVFIQYLVHPSSSQKQFARRYMTYWLHTMSRHDRGIYLCLDIRASKNHDPHTLMTILKKKSHHSLASAAVSIKSLFIYETILWTSYRTSFSYSSCHHDFLV